MHADWVPHQVLLSPHMLPPWSGLLDWSRFSVRLEPTKANLRRLGAHLGALDHSRLLAGVRAAKHALTYHLDGYTGRECVLIAC
jgi:hypothetical protein